MQSKQNNRLTHVIVIIVPRENNVRMSVRRTKINICELCKEKKRAAARALFTFLLSTNESDTSSENSYATKKNSKVELRLELQKLFTLPLEEKLKASSFPTLKLSLLSRRKEIENFCRRGERSSPIDKMIEGVDQCENI